MHDAMIDESAKAIKPGSKENRSILDNHHSKADETTAKWTAVDNVLSFLWMPVLEQSYPNEPPMIESAITYANRYFTK